MWQSFESDCRVIGGIANGLVQTANNYAKAEHTSTATGRGGPTTYPPPPVADDIFVTGPDPAEGAGHSSVPDWLAQYWPNGDTDALRSAAQAWPVSELLVDLGVLRSHSRPRTSNDNPYSEAQFKTMKYVPDFPDRFGSLEDARTFCEGFFLAYNHEHRHSGIGMHTPASVHFGTAEQIRTQRQFTLDRAYAAHPERFARRPRPPALPEVAWINEPSDQPPPAQ